MAEGRRFELLGPERKCNSATTTESQDNDDERVNVADPIGFEPTVCSVTGNRGLHSPTGPHCIGRRAEIRTRIFDLEDRCPFLLDDAPTLQSRARQRAVRMWRARA